VDRSQKEQLVSALNQTFGEVALVVVTQQTGMTVAESADLRRQMRDAGASFKVTKNRLTRRALVGTKFETLQALFSGPTGMAFSEDPVAAARVCVKYAKSNDKLKIVGGNLNGEMLDTAGVDELAKLPSLDELRGKIVGVIQAPAQKLVGVTQAPAGQLARVFSAYGSKGEAA